MKTLLLFLLVPALSFGQTYEEANPGALHVYLDVSSDTAHLKSLIGKFTQSDVAKLKAFLHSPEALELQNQPADRLGGRVQQVEDMLKKVLNRKIDPCRMMASDTLYTIFNSPLENEVIRPLILWVKKNYYMCQMAETVWGFDEAKQKVGLLNKKKK